MKSSFKNTFRLLGLVFVTVIATSVTACAKNGDDEVKTFSWRYKITVNVDTPEGIKTGSAVRQNEVRLMPYPQDTRNPFRTKTKIKGEAVVVDLGKRGKLFALLSVDDYRLVFSAFPGPPGLTPKGLEFYQNLRNAKATIPLGPTPGLVTFGDPEIPESVKAITDHKRGSDGWPLRPLEFVDRTQEVFGSGVTIKNISIEMTDESVTKGIIKTLPWLPRYYNQMLDGLRYNTIKSKNPVANSLASGAFSTEEAPNGR